MSRLAPWASERARTRLGDLEQRYVDLAPRDVLDAVRTASERHVNRYDEAGLVLYAGTNSPSPAVRSAMDARLAGRPSMGYPDDKYQYGLDDLDHLEAIAMAMIGRAFRAGFAEVRLTSASLCNLAVYAALTRPGDTIAVLPAAAGGHTSHHPEGVAGVRGLKVVELPYDYGELDVDLAALPSFLAQHGPRLLVVGASLLLFPHRLREIRAAAEAAGAHVLYDASHVAGLIAGGEFQQPLEEGAHLMTFSTYKSFGGPPGGCVVTNDPELAERVANAAYPGLIANYDIARLGPLAVAAAEAIEFGADYAKACIDNARALAQALDGQGMELTARGSDWTASHHVAPIVEGSGDAAARKLADAGIYVSVMPRTDGRDALRLGTQEVTRRGMRVDVMQRAAAWIARVLRGDAGGVREEVAEMRREYQGYAFCYLGREP